MKHRYTSMLLHSHRVLKDIPKIEVARHLKISTQFYGEIEKGRVGLPPVYFKKTVKFLNLKEQHLIDALIADYKEVINNYL